MPGSAGSNEGAPGFAPVAALGMLDHAARPYSEQSPEARLGVGFSDGTVHRFAHLRDRHNVGTTQTQAVSRTDFLARLDADNATATSVAGSATFTQSEWAVNWGTVDGVSAVPFGMLLLGHAVVDLAGTATGGSAAAGGLSTGPKVGGVAVGIAFADRQLWGKARKMLDADPDNTRGEFKLGARDVHLGDVGPGHERLLAGAREDDGADVGVRLRRGLRELERIAADVGDAVEDLRRLVIVREDHRAPHLLQLVDRLDRRRADDRIDAGSRPAPNQNRKFSCG